MTSSNNSVVEWTGEVSVHQMACHFHLLYFWGTDTSGAGATCLLLVGQHMCYHRGRQSQGVDGVASPSHPSTPRQALTRMEGAPASYQYTGGERRKSLYSR